MALELCFCYTLSYDLIDFLAALWVDVKQVKRPKQHLCDSSVKQLIAFWYCFAIEASSDVYRSLHVVQRRCHEPLEKLSING